MILPTIGIQAQNQSSKPFNPLTSLGWYAAYWAGDPNWANPGDGGTLTSWRDGSGNNRHLTSVNGTPIWRASEANMNNKPIVDFNSAAISETSASWGTILQPNSIVIVGRWRNVAANVRIMVDTRSATNRQRLGRAATPNEYVLNSGTSLLSTGIAPNTTRHLWTGVSNATSSILELDGANVNTGNAGAQSMSGLSICGDTAGTAYSQVVDMAFVGIYRGNVLNHPRFADFESWVTSEYDITMS